MAQKVGEMQLSSPQIAQHREDVGARGDLYRRPGARRESGGCVSFSFTGLPHAPMWPRNAALALASRDSRCRGVGERAATPRGPRRRARPSESREAARSALHRAHRDRAQRQPRPAIWIRAAARAPASRAHHRARIGLRGARPLTIDFSSLTFADVTLDFQRRRALDRVSVTFNAGEIVAVLGPNGAGKTTLLFVAATLLAPYVRRRSLRGLSAAGGARRAARVASAWSATISMCIQISRRPRTCVSSPPVSGRWGGWARRVRRCGRRGSTSGPTNRSARTREACGSVWRSSARSSTIPGWCCSTSRLPGWTSRRPTTLDSALRRLRERGCIVVVTTHDIEAVDGLADRAVLLKRGAAVPDRGRRRDRCASDTVSSVVAVLMRDSWAFLTAVWLVVSKDLAIEWRSREIVYTTLFFAVSCVLVFAFGFVREGRAAR